MSGGYVAKILVSRFRCVGLYAYTRLAIRADSLEHIISQKVRTNIAFVAFPERFDKRTRVSLWKYFIGLIIFDPSRWDDVISALRVEKFEVHFDIGPWISTRWNYSTSRVS